MKLTTVKYFLSVLYFTLVLHNNGTNAGGRKPRTEEIKARNAAIPGSGAKDEQGSAPKKEATKKVIQENVSKKGDAESSDIVPLTKSTIEFAQRWNSGLEPNATVDQFEPVENGKEVGKGNFGTVTVVKYKPNNKIYAMKKNVLIKSTTNNGTISCDWNLFAEELRTTLASKSKFLVPVHYYYWDIENCLAYTAMPYYRAGDFYHLISHYTNSFKRIENESHRYLTVQFYAANIVLALQYMQARNAVHRDIKLENLLVGDDGYLLLADFGFATLLSPGCTSNTNCGSPTNMAPEIYEGKPYTKTVDWWSLGVMLHEMVAGYKIFSGMNMADLKQKVLALKISDSFLLYSVGKVSPKFADLIEKLLVRDPKKRLGANGHEEVKKHPFFDGLDWIKLHNKNPEIQVPYIPKYVNGQLSHFWDTFANEKVECQGKK